MMYQVIKHRIDPVSTFGWYIRPRKQKKYLAYLLIISTILSLMLIRYIGKVSNNFTYEDVRKDEVIARNY